MSRTYLIEYFPVPPSARTLVLVTQDEHSVFGKFDSASKTFLAEDGSRSYGVDEIYAWTDANGKDGHAEVDWSVAPEFANFWAVQPDQRAVWFAEIASRPSDGGPFEISGPQQGAPMFGWHGDYEQSLTFRPEHVLAKKLR